MRRPSHAAGPSWRKWSDPLVYGALDTDSRLYRRIATLTFWLACIDVGAVAALWVAR